MQINWSLLGAPVDVGAAGRQGFEYGWAFRQRERQDEFQRAAFSAYDPNTGNVDAPAMRRAFVGAGDLQGALQFDAQQATRADAMRVAQQRQLTQIARLVDGVRDQASYEQALGAARQMGLDVSAAPPQYDAAWVDRQRQIMRVMADPEQMTTFMRDARAAGIEPGSADFRRLFENRYAPPMQAVDVTNADGSVDRTYIPRPTASAIGGAGGAATLQPGTVVNGMRFRGGDRRDPANWEQAGEGGPSVTPAGSF